MDMSSAFIKGASEYFLDAVITFGKFHVIQEANKAVDAVRRTERKTCAELKNTRYVWLKNEKNLTKKQKGMLDKLKDVNLIQPRLIVCAFVFRKFINILLKSLLWF